MKKVILILATVMASVTAQASEMWEKREIPAVTAWAELISLKVIPMKIYSQSENTKITLLDESYESAKGLAVVLDGIFTRKYLARRLENGSATRSALWAALRSGETTLGEFAELLSRHYRFQLEEQQ